MENCITANEMNAVVDKSAESWANSARAWYVNGKLHRGGDKPAEIWVDGTQYWYKNGKQLKKYHYTKKLIIPKVYTAIFF